MRKFQDQIGTYLREIHTELRIYLERVWRESGKKAFLKLDRIEGDKLLYKKVIETKNLCGELEEKWGVDISSCLWIFKDSLNGKINELKNLQEWECNKYKNYIHEMVGIRNDDFAHSPDVYASTPEELFRIFDTFYRFTIIIEGKTELIDDLNKIRSELGNIIFKFNEHSKEQKVPVVNKADSDAKQREKKNTYTIQAKGYIIEIELIDVNPENRKVLSVPAGVTYDLIQEHKIHSCPNEGKLYQYKSTKYIAFRNSSGEMESVFIIEKILIINDFKKAMKQHKNKVYEIIKSAIDKKKHPLETVELKRLKKYCTSEVFKGFLNFFPNNRFYILSDDVEHLPDKKVFEERKTMRSGGSGEKKEESVSVYYDLSDFRG